MKDKIFHDTVHGNIRIRENYCKEVIDTILFQRLRRIEQSSVRSLYPCARHDRFIHSIGVFHIGTGIVEWAEQNTKQEYGGAVWNLVKDSWEVVTSSYILACLLHDVGHAPFSHTLEKYYDYKQGNLLDVLLSKALTSEPFKQDLSISKDAKQHEKVSAYLLATYYKNAVEKLGGNIEYAARMIIGCPFNDDESIETQLVNCFITVLHGEVDADRLDYVVRDQWAAGFSSARIDIERLLRSIIIVQDPKCGNKLRLCFTKSAINTIEALAQIKDFQKKWVFRHQNVVYDQHILSAALEEVAKHYKSEENKTEDDVLNYIFNVKIFTDSAYALPDNLCLYLLSDDTIIQMLRTTIDDNSFAMEWLARQYKKKPLWKTPAEYNRLFNRNKGIINTDKIKMSLKRLGVNIEDYYLEEVKYKPYTIPENQVWLWINDEIIDANSMIPGTADEETVIYYLYVDNTKLNEKDNIINKLKAIT